ncbi:MAG: hypothetical protein ACYC4U_12840 [Pirellulaceae bacterium]
MTTSNDYERISSSSLMRDAKQRFLQIARNFTILNPHLDLTLDWHGERYEYRATEPAWVKWLPSNPTSVHWYEIEHFERLAAAYVAADQQEGRDRTVREFISEFAGLSGTAKQKAVLDATGLARKNLSDLISGDQLDHSLITNLVAAMKANSRPVKPERLGVIGKDHIEKQLRSLGCGDASIRYEKKMGESGGIPWVLECAFGWNDSLEGRQLITGVNWSPSIGNPFRQLGKVGVSLDSVLESQRAGEEEPVVVLVHLAIARATFADRGKSTLVIGE